ncbi:hypothetical protein ID866_5522 [Astraeus odoratus]|nr:hypothetical protein ID866_5522 [Astraeus odoratus]
MSLIKCITSQVLQTELEVVRRKVTLKETEDSWSIIAEGISHLTSLCHKGGCDLAPDMISGIRSLSRPLNSAMNSERSRLSGAAVDLVSVLAITFGSSFEPLVPLFMPTLLGLCCRTNKVFVSRAKTCIIAIIEHTQLPCILHYLTDLATRKSVPPRLTAAEGILACLNCFNPPDLEKEARAHAIEDFIKLTARDANADVRKASRKIFEAYKTLMPARVDSFVAPLTPIVKKYLDIRDVPDRQRIVNVEGTVKSSVKHAKTSASVGMTRPRAAQHPPNAAQAFTSRGATSSGKSQKSPPPGGFLCTFQHRVRPGGEANAGVASQEHHVQDASRQIEW